MSYWSFDHRVSENDVVHYGRKRMKWGQHIFGRNDPQKQKTRLQKYKERELNKLDKKYNKKIRAERLSLQRGKTNLWESSRMRKHQQKLSQLMANKKIEEKFVKKMQYSDMEKEKIAVGKQYIKSTLITAGTLPLYLVGLPSIVSIPNPSNVKTNYRLKNRGV